MDLGIFVSRQVKNSEESNIKDQISEIAAGIERLEEKRLMKLQERAQKQSYCDQTFGKIERLELKLSSEGGNFASKRNELKAQKSDSIMRLRQNVIVSASCVHSFFLSR